MKFVLILSSSWLLAQAPVADPQFQALKHQLEQSQFKVLLAPPPQRGAYGALNPQTRTIWIDPLSFDLGIAVPVLVHEAVHAAQTCKGKGKGNIAPLGLTLEPLVYAQPFWLRYGDIHRKDLEREAFTVQTQENRLDLVSGLLRQYCTK
ncbi:hypothetical protein [Synechocystis sp. LKSZ1]|uniref:hypothetical protein n=1 Tax=Synechocystis sp. LKSZ1 TaxID=3144951 RepID=UPI00336C185D